jgi:hypothetical protein
MGNALLEDVPGDDPLAEGVDEEVDATGVVGLYVTPLALAATWKTEPPPNS